MTTYTTITNGQVDQDSPVTQTLMTALRDNPIAIAEGDSTVPEGLRTTSLLATLSPTSGTSISTPTLDLTGYRKLFISYDAIAVSNTGGTESLSVAGTGVWIEDILSGFTVTGAIQIELVSGVGFAVMQRNTGTAQLRAFKTSITTATTTIAFTSASTYTTGTIRVFAEH